MRSDRERAPDGGDGGDGGFVTAETAVALPVLVLLTGVLVWGVLVGAAQLRCVDAAREAARVAARGDPQGRVLDAARSAGPRGATVSVSEGGDTVSVRVSATARAPGGLGGLLAVDVAATASAVREPGTVGRGDR
ncbi:TadE-like protein [Streptomyces sp. 846.5]|nr:TadE family type IV pilus minor pilin [Streptomyces sp. 846.5]TDU05627.1 TadE-like protein [Streptomyces sp. 846.5]